jgi:hypothetical protein
MMRPLSILQKRRFDDFKYWLFDQITKLKDKNSIINTQNIYLKNGKKSM